MLSHAGPSATSITLK